MTLNGDAENVRHENAGLENVAQTCRGWKMREWKIQHKTTRGGKCGKGKVWNAICQISVIILHYAYRMYEDNNHMLP